jgi:hypothetical protein
MGGDYTVEPQLRIPRGRRIDFHRLRLPLALAGVAVLLAYLFIRPVARLADGPPAGFIDTRPEWDAERNAAERRMALAYWERAKTALQWEYVFGSELPEQPPPEFSLEANQFPGMAKVVAESRLRYWRRLRKVWGSPGAWKTSYEWNTDWASKVMKVLF